MLRIIRLVFMVLVVYSAGYSSSFGLISYVNAAHFNNNGHFSQPNLGSGVGVYYSIPLKGDLSLVNEIIINNIGAVYISYLYDIPYKTVYRLKYLEVPILLQYTMELPLSFQGYLFGGPMLGFNLKQSATTKIGSLVQRHELNNFDPANFAITLGAGIRTSHFKVDVRYTYGLLTIISVPGGGYKTSSFSVSVGLPFSK